MNAKTWVFTVTDSESIGKPIIWCQMTTDKAAHDQTEAAELIHDWLHEHEIFVDQVKLEDLAYSMRVDGYVWIKERYCFELTEVVG